MKLKATVTDEDELFSPRERTVLGLLSQGLLQKQIAAHLDRSTKTIECQITSIHKKLGTRSPHETVATAVARGLVRISMLCLVYGISLQVVTDNDIEARRPPSRVVRVRTGRSSALNVAV